MFTIHHRFAALAVLCLIAPLAAESGTPDESALERALEAHDRAVEGSELAVDNAIEILEAFLEENPGHSLARAHLGSAYTLKARDAALWRKRSWVERGVEIIDSAVEADPGNPRVRLIRAINAYNLPRRAGRYELASEDFAILLDAVDDDDAAIDDAMQRAVYFHAGAFALKEREDERALALLEKAAAVESEGENELEAQIASLLRLARNRNP